MIEKDKENIVFEDYQREFNYEKNQSKINISFNRISFIFFIFFITCFVYSLKIIYLGSLKTKIEPKIFIKKNKYFRADIIDNNGNILSKTTNIKWAGINPRLIIDQKKLLINLRLIFPNKDYEEIKKKIKLNKYFVFEKKIDEEKIKKLKFLGDKSIIFEDRIRRIYPQKSLFSHILGQTDDSNVGISGIEKYFDNQLKTRGEPLQLTVDTDIQFLIREELIRFQEIFKSIGSTSILMNVNNGNILSIVSLPDYDLNRREEIKDEIYINRATKGVYELGSVFKTFTVASGFNEGVIKPETEFINLPKKIICAGRSIEEYDDKIPSDLTAEEILIRSGNIGSVRIGQKVGIEKLKLFLENIGVLNKIEFDLEEVGQPISFRWGKCKLATVSFGHGITTTPLQLAKAYSIITNGGYNIKPTLVKKNLNKIKKKKRILNKGVSEMINPILRKIVSSKEGTANFANISGYDVGGKTGTAQKSVNGIYSKKKINTFAAVFPISKPQYVLIVLLDEPKPNKEYIYYYRDGSGWKYKGTPYNTAGWTSVEIAGKIIEKIGPILATKYMEVN